MERIPLLSDDMYLVKNVMPEVTNQELYNKANAVRPRQLHPTAQAFGKNWTYSSGPERQDFYFAPGKTHKITSFVYAMMQEDDNLTQRGMVFIHEADAKDKYKVAMATIAALESAYNWYFSIGTEKLIKAKQRFGLNDQDFERYKLNKFLQYYIASVKADLIQEKIAKISKGLDSITPTQEKQVASGNKRLMKEADGALVEV